VKSWQRIVVAIGAVLGALFYVLDSFFPAREPAWLFILALPGVLILAPLIAFMDTDVYLLVPVTNALAFWLLTLSPRIFTRRWSRTALLVVACLSVMAVAGFGLHRYRQHLDDDIEASWNPASRLFDWGPGAVTMPERFTYEKQQGIDSLVGKFVSDDGKFTIEFDIGELAGQHSGCRGSTETLRFGSRVFTGQVRDQEGIFAKVSFPDNGCANFWAFTAEEPRLEALDILAGSFQPNSRLPAWIQPWLPKWIRYECRIGSLF
jgi:hypothetical protein